MNKKRHTANLSLDESPWITTAGPAKWPNNGGFGGVGGFLFPKTQYKNKIKKQHILSLHLTACVLCITSPSAVSPQHS
jgi:hypothetical protein